MQKYGKIILLLIAAFLLIFIGYRLFKPASVAAPASEAPVPGSTQQNADIPEGAARYAINAEKSEVTFTIDEILAGKPKTVMGTTNAVTGNIDLIPNKPANSSVGKISVDATTLKTDDENRNKMIALFILQTEAPENQFITFEPTDISVQTDQILEDVAYEVRLSGPLTVRGVSRNVDFNGTFTRTSGGELIGSASTTILYPDFDITIPSVPLVASVEDQVILNINFSADKVN